MTYWIFDEYVTSKIISYSNTSHDFLNLQLVSKKFYECAQNVITRELFRKQLQILFTLNKIFKSYSDEAIDNYVYEHLWIGVQHDIRYHKLSWTTVLDGVMPIIYNKVLLRPTTPIIFSNAIMDLHKDLTKIPSRIAGYSIISQMQFHRLHFIGYEDYNYDNCTIISTNEKNPNDQYKDYDFNAIRKEERRIFGKLYVGKKFDGMYRTYYMIITKE